MHLFSVFIDWEKCAAKMDEEDRDGALNVMDDDDYRSNNDFCSRNGEVDDDDSSISTDHPSTPDPTSFIAHQKRLRQLKQF